MKKALKRLFVILVAGLALVVLLLIGAAAIFQKEIGKQLLSALNARLLSPVLVDDVELSLIRNFPNASIRLANARLAALSGGDVLHARDVRFHFGLLNLLGNELAIHSVTITEGSLHLYVDKQGRATYQLFKTTDAPAEGERINISLEKASLHNIQFIYHNAQLDQHISQFLHWATFSGSFSEERFTLQSEANLTSKAVEINGEQYFADKNWSYKANILTDKATQKGEFQNVQISIDNSLFELTGEVQTKPEGQDYSLGLSGDNIRLESILSLVPQSRLEGLSDISSTGRLQLRGSIRGLYSNGEFPAIDVEVQLQNGKLMHPQLRPSIQDVTFRASFTNKAKNATGNTVLDIPDFKAYLAKRQISIGLRIENFSDPYIDLIADGELPLQEFRGFLRNPSISDISGDLIFRTIKMSGLLRHIVSEKDIPKVFTRGEIELKNVTFSTGGEEIMLRNGILEFDDNVADVQGLVLVGAGSEVLLGGSAQNILPVVFSKNDGSELIPLNFQVELDAKRFDAGRLVQIVQHWENEIDDHSRNKPGFSIEYLGRILHGVFQARVDNFVFDKLQGKNFDGMFILEDGDLRILGKAEGMQGAISVDGTLQLKSEPELTAKLSCDGLGIKDFFWQTNNVGQDFLRYEHLEGLMNARIWLHASWDSTLAFEPDQLHVMAGLGIKDGFLKNFELLEQWSDFVKADDLRNVRVENLQNWIEVRNSTVYIPVMFVQNNAMNITVCGQQTFSGDIEYSMKINAGQVLARKLQSRNSSLEPIPAQKDGFFNLYFFLTGNLDDYAYRTDRKAVLRRFSESERIAAGVRRILEETFGERLHLLNEPAAWKDATEPGVFFQSDDVEYIEGF